MTAKHPVLVNGGAMSKPDRKAIMTRAWAIFRQTYNYPRMPFAKIGRDCFAWALRTAWAEARKAARIAAIDEATRQTRIASLILSIELEQFNDSWPLARVNVARMQAEIAQLKGCAAAKL